MSTREASYRRLFHLENVPFSIPFASYLLPGKADVFMGISAARMNHETLCL